MSIHHYRQTLNISLLLSVRRFIAALGSGSANILSAMYLGEIAHHQIRGALVVLINQMMSIGILLAYSVGPWVSRQALAGVGLSLPIIFALIFIWMPESPYFLVMKKRTEAAEKSLTWLRGTSVVHKELEQIEESIESEETGTFTELIMTPGNRKVPRIVLCSGTVRKFIKYYVLIYQVIHVLVFRHY